MMLEYRCNDYESLNMLFRAEPTIKTIRLIVYTATLMNFYTICRQAVGYHIHIQKQLPLSVLQVDYEPKKLSILFIGVWLLSVQVPDTCILRTSAFRLTILFAL